MADLSEYGDDEDTIYEEDNSGMSVAQPQLRKILTKIAEFGATYPSELAAYCDLTSQQVGKLLRELEDEGILERLKPGWKHNDKRLLSRVGGSHGTFDGKDEVKQAHWYGLNSDREWRIHDNSKDVWMNEYWEKVEHSHEDGSCDMKDVIREAADKTA